MTRRKSVYLAGPEVFLPDASSVVARKIALCAGFGFEALVPGDNDQAMTAARADGLSVSMAIYRANIALMTLADFGIFNLAPFRGPSADAGTVFELGFMTGLGKRAYGYTDVATDYADRLPSQPNTGPVVLTRDANGWLVERFGKADNLMIDCALEANGTSMVRHEAPAGLRLRDVTGFVACLAQARADLWLSAA
jgi:nucleoside 2-deoxyribosyltransferase